MVRDILPPIGRLGHINPSFTEPSRSDHLSYRSPLRFSALRELAAGYPQMDLDRVGIYGHSGGGFASTDAILRYPEFFKVAVSSAGNHDQRGYHFPWGEKYHGLLTKKGDGDSYDSQANQNLAANLRGRLMLTFGTLDDNVHGNMTLRVADELIKANKTFDKPAGREAAGGLFHPSGAEVTV